MSTSKGANQTHESPIDATTAPVRLKASNYPEPFASQMQGRLKRPLGDLFGIQGFGVNFTEMSPGSVSSVLHSHSKQEEFIYILEGRPTLVRESETYELRPGSCVGFTPKTSAHKLENRTSEKVVYLEIGTRISDDSVVYPQDDLEAKMGADGKWAFVHKDGRPY